ncbi:unnamed protein product [Hermetia illucens]|uniref:Ionotropic receptor n=1 Tax=Hermetia illucens TaxID=343691 RepID=A0A7R8UBP1_HERIL|nr:uncharacterized protein LOC119646687 [Hermetia illucens]CAD7076984.1 unnamed protein product [Hermetia illucens]
MFNTGIPFSVLAVLLSILAVFGRCCWQDDAIISLQRQSDFHTIVFVSKGHRVNQNLLAGLKSPVMFIQDSSTINIKRFPNKNNLFIFIIRNDPGLLTKCQPNSLDVIRSAKTILWFLEKVDNSQAHALFYFEFMWKLGILNVVAMFSLDCRRGEILTFTPFPVFKIYELTPEQDLFPNKLKDLHGFPITTIIKTDEPRVFRYKDRHGHQRIGGYASKIFMSFLEKHNATLNEYLIPNDTYVRAENLINLVRKHEVTISMHPYRQNGSDVDGSYPVRMVKVCIMYPAPAEVRADKYLLYSFSTSVGIILSFMAGYILFINLWLAKVITDHFQVGILLLDSVRALVFQAYVIWAFRKLWKYRMVRLSIVLFSFFFASAYQSLLAGIFTTRVFERPVSTKAEMITAGLGIYVIDFEFGFYESVLKPPEFKNLYIPVDTETFNRHRNILNTSYAYNTPDEKALFLMQQQNFLERPLFIFSNVCVETVFTGFFMPHGSPFKDAFNTVLLRCFQSGLYFKWDSDAFTEAVEAGILERKKTVGRTMTPLSLSHLQLNWIILSYGLLTGCVCFFIEILLKSSPKLWTPLCKLRYKWCKMSFPNFRKNVNIEFLD